MAKRKTPVPPSPKHEPPADFYGSRIVINPDGSKTTTYHGGFKPGIMTRPQFAAFFELLKK